MEKSQITRCWEGCWCGRSNGSPSISPYDRIPNHPTAPRRHAILGCVLVKELAWVDKTEAVPVARLKMRSIPTLPANIALYDLLRLFQASTVRC